MLISFAILMNLFVLPTCCCDKPCCVITMSLSQFNFLSVFEIIDNEPIFGSWLNPSPLFVFLYNLPETVILSSYFLIRIGTFPVGAARMLSLTLINSSIDSNFLNIVLSNSFPIISTPKVSSILVPKILVSVGFLLSFALILYNIIFLQSG